MPLWCSRLWKTITLLWVYIRLFYNIVQFILIQFLGNRCWSSLNVMKRKRPRINRKETGPDLSQKHSQEGYSGQKLCIYIRNFPFDVTKVEVQKFFADFSLAEDDICLLYDDKGVGLGEALVKFKSEEQAVSWTFKPTEILGDRGVVEALSEAQMQEFGAFFLQY